VASYRILCVDTEHAHRHVTKVCTGKKADRYSRTWTVEEVRDALEAGDRFYTLSPTTGKEADVTAEDCSVDGCPAETIRSKADAIMDNNLENMPSCV
jgi:Protein of unknown function (DUF3892)